MSSYDWKPTVPLMLGVKKLKSFPCSALGFDQVLL
jgi:hypothetical protein